MGLGLFEVSADAEDRLPRSERLLDPRRDERRVPLGEYSDDMFSIITLQGRHAVRRNPLHRNGTCGCFSSEAAHPLTNT